MIDTYDDDGGWAGLGTALLVIGGGALLCYSLRKNDQEHRKQLELAKKVATPQKIAKDWSKVNVSDLTYKDTVQNLNELLQSGDHATVRDALIKHQGDLDTCLATLAEDYKQTEELMQEIWEQSDAFDQLAPGSQLWDDFWTPEKEALLDHHFDLSIARERIIGEPWMVKVEPGEIQAFVESHGKCVPKYPEDRRYW